MKVKVYTGMTLEKREVLEIIPGAFVVGPVQRDDVLYDIDSRVNVVVIIDGKFQQSLAVSPGEIMDALRCGLKVYGSSSMGALRASELYPYGMVGCGEIFELIRDTPYFRDDFLGQSFHEDGTKNISVPYINFHFALKKLVQSAQISQEDGEFLDNSYRNLHFTERDLINLKLLIKRDHSRCETLCSIAEMAMRTFNQKRDDAINLLNEVRDHLAWVQARNVQIAKAQRNIKLTRIFDASPCRRLTKRSSVA